MASKAKQNRDAQFISVLCRMGYILSIVPPLHKCSSVRFRFFYQWYTIFIFLVIMVGNGLAIYGRCKESYEGSPSTLVFTDIAVNIGTTITNVFSVVVLSLWKFDDFKLFYEIFSNANDCLLKNKNLTLSRCKAFYIELILGHVCILLLFIYDAYVWINGLGFKIFRHYIFRDFQNYHLYITVMIIYNFAISMKHRFEEINDTLRKVTNLPECKGSSINTQLVKMDKCDSHLGVRQISQLYEVLLLQISLFNKLFGWQIFFMTFSIMMGLLNSLDILTVYTFLRQKDDSLHFGYDLIILSSLWALFQVVSKLFLYLCNLNYIKITVYMA